MNFSRRSLLKASAAATVMGSIGAPLVARAQQAEFVYKYANNLPDTHPMNVRAKEMSAAIKQETNGRVDLQVFPNNQLGSDTDVLSQIRSGGVEFFTLSGLILSTLVPAASINGKYGKLLRKIKVEADRQNYGDFREYGQYQATDYAGHAGIPAGYWVYVYPHWYIWGEQKK